MKDILILSLKNLKAYKKFYIQLIVLLLCVVFIISVFSVFSITLTDNQNLLKEQSISANYFITEQDINIAEFNIDAEILKFKKYRFDSDLVPGYGGVYTDLIKMTCNGKIYIPQDFYEEFEVYSFNNNKLFTTIDFAEAKARFNSDNLIIGHYPKNTDEILLSYDFVKAFGFSEDILGSIISFEINKNNFPLLSNKKVVGLLNENYCSLAGHNQVYTVRPFVVVHSDYILPSETTENIDYNMYVLKDWARDDIINLFEKEYNARYVGNSIKNNLQNISDMKEFAFAIFLLLGCTLLAGLVLIIYLVINKFAQMFLRNSGILLASGISNKKLYSLLLLQLLWASLIAYVLAIILIIGGTYLLSFAMQMAFYLTLKISFITILLMLIISIASSFVLVLALCMFVILKLKNKSIREFLQ